MQKPIPRKYHGIADYLYIPTVLVLPKLVGFAGKKTAATLCRVLSLSVLASTLFTRAEWGAYKKIPYKTHLGMDAASGAFAIAAPWLFKFSRNAKARNTFLAIGAVTLLIDVLSRSNEMPTPKQRRIVR